MSEAAEGIEGAKGVLNEESMSVIGKGRGGSMVYTFTRSSQLRRVGNSSEQLEFPAYNLNFK